MLSNNTPYSAVVLQVTSSLTLNDGAVIQNSIKYNDNSPGGAAIYANNAATIVMNGGSLRNNTSYRRGGAVYLDDGADMTLNGGEITGNKAAPPESTSEYGGGGIYIREASFTMTGGSITNNTSTYGYGGIYNTSYGTLTITGGIISGNSSAKGGDGIYHSSFENAKAVLKIGGDANIEDDICLTSGVTNKFSKITAPLKNNIKFTVQGAEVGRMISEGENYTLTYADMAKIKVTNSNLMLSLDNNQISLSSTEDIHSIYFAYDSNGGDTNVPASEEIAVDPSLQSPTRTVDFSTVPTREGYVFLGWDTNKNAVTPTYTQAAGEQTITLSDNVTLYAIWEALPKYTITAAAGEGGTVSGGGEIFKGGSITLTATANKGYTFAGWYDGETKVSSKADFVVGNVTENKTYTAKFEEKVELDYVAYDNNSNQYTSLAAAVEGAVDGSIITLIKDDTATQKILIKKNLIIDLDGHNLPSTVFAITAGDVVIRDSEGTGVINANRTAGYIVEDLGLDTDFDLDHRVSASIVVTGTAKVSVNNVTIHNDGGSDLTKGIYLGGSEANGTSLVLNHVNLISSDDVGNDAIFYYNEKGSSLYMESVVTNDTISVWQYPDTTKFIISSADLSTGKGPFWVEKGFSNYITNQQDAQKFLAERSYFVIEDGKEFDYKHVVVASGLSTSGSYTEPEYGSTEENEPSKVVIPGDGESVEIGPQIVGGKGEYLYQWYKDDVAIEGATQPTLSVTEPGRYKVVVTDSLTGETIYVYWLIVEEKITHTVSVSAQAGGTASASAETVEHGDAVVLTATVNEGYTFDGWYDGNTKISSSLTHSVTITGDKTFTAKFLDNVVQYYTVTATAGKGGTVTGGGKVIEGGSATVKATANKWYNFAGWYDGDVKVSDSAEYVVENVTANKTYTAKFIAYYIITAAAEEGGTVTGGGRVNKGESVTLTATANEGYTFGGWYDGDVKVSDSAEYVVENVTADKTYKAKFTKNIVYYTITTVAEEGGTVTDGGNIVIKAVANKGYTFDGWYVNGEKVSNEAGLYIDNITADKTYTAKFIAYYTITAAAEEGGTVAGGGRVNKGKSVTLTATANEGYTFAGWYDGETKVSDSAEYVVENVTESKTFTAKFKANETEGPDVPVTDYPTITVANGKLIMVANGHEIAKVSIAYIGTEAKTIKNWTQFETAGKEYTDINGSVGCKHYRNVADGNAWTMKNSGYYAIYINASDITSSIYLVKQLKLPSINEENGRMILSAEGANIEKVSIAYIGETEKPITNWTQFETAGKEYPAINDARGCKHYNNIVDGYNWIAENKGYYAYYIKADGYGSIYGKVYVGTPVEVPFVAVDGGNIVLNAGGSNVERVSIAYIGETEKTIKNWTQFETAGKQYPAINDERGCKHYSNVADKTQWGQKTAGYYAVYIKATGFNSIYNVVKIETSTEVPVVLIPEMTITEGTMSINTNSYEVKKVSIAYIGETERTIKNWTQFETAGKEYTAINGELGCKHYNNVTDGQNWTLENTGYYAVYIKYVDGSGVTKSIYLVLDGNAQA